MLYFTAEGVPPGVVVLSFPGNWWHNHGGRGMVALGVFWQLATRGRRLAFARRRGQIQAPTLIVWGEDDQLLPVQHAYSAHALIPGARLRVFPACGHAPNIEHAQAFNQDLLAFLRGV
jgi:pimeloyl-ACP methyl ester carboxylesterase